MCSNPKQVYVLLIDASKSFDKVSNLSYPKNNYATEPWNAWYLIFPIRGFHWIPVKLYFLKLHMWKINCVHYTSQFCHLGIRSPDFIYTAVMKIRGSLHGPPGAINNFSSTLLYYTDFHNFLHMTACYPTSEQADSRTAVRLWVCGSAFIYLGICIYVIYVCICAHV